MLCAVVCLIFVISFVEHHFVGILKPESLVIGHAIFIFCKIKVDWQSLCQAIKFIVVVVILVVVIVIINYCFKEY